ncbi:hypothetical protein BC835DRAFT_1311550 [Cytidiella melzeri]|nr:hypothetical protein BC835DRAFT_1311550 [Cytidiella melzeri]
MPVRRMHASTDHCLSPLFKTQTLTFVSRMQHMIFASSVQIAVSSCDMLLFGFADHKQPVATMLQYRLYGGHSLPAGIQRSMKAGANIGSVIGQLGFGFSADYFGRKAFCDISPNSALAWLAVWGIILGIFD